MDPADPVRIRPPDTIVIHVTRPQPDSRDEWRLNHPYLLDATPSELPELRHVLANFDDLAQVCRHGETMREAAWIVNRTPQQLLSGVGYAHLHNYLNMQRRGDRLTVATTGAAPSPKHADPALAARHDPQHLNRNLPNIADRAPTYTMFALAPTRHEHWALDSRYARGTWGQLLGPNANRLLGIIAAELRDPDGELSIRAAAHHLRITPRRLHAELDQLHCHGLIDIEHDHGAIATSGLVRAPSPDLLDANPLVAASHRCLIRQRAPLTPQRAFDL